MRQRIATRRASAPWRKFHGAWSVERRRLRMTKEVGTLPSGTDRVSLFNGGAREAILAAATLVYAFLYCAGLRAPPKI
jgi:hypothetical protein